MQNNDLISRKGLLLSLPLFNPDQNGYPLNGGIQYARAMIEAAPTMDAPVVHGRWEVFCRGKMCCCSVCKTEFDNTCNDILNEWKHCPECGARMDQKG